MAVTPPGHKALFYYTTFFPKYQPSAFFRLECHRSRMVHSNDGVTEGAMPNKETMTIDERYKLLRIVQEDYGQAKRKERSQLLDHTERLRC